ncbi:Translation initiation factor IF2/IF5,Translation initiation factor IF2/IF5, N- [Cinara cedri]|uniref:Eukaryotic translation initiation factor 2 subunit 2 n=1 Tax=Cinara cedri TaxID=506608 RepID=A0A5E4M6K5_9HEMI|nr:Translation initiation factor IF2/IF5,Translation initiation factor IF2/IF5, N- [Cinara cedri]
MNEEEALFDPSIKKKKKKKKFDLDSALASEGGNDSVNDQTLDKENQDPVPDPDEFDDGNLDLDNFGGKKKKKKKKVTINLDDLENALPDTSSALENGDNQGDAMDDDFDLDMDFSKTTKKKKKKKKDIDELVAEEMDKKGDKFDDNTDGESHTWFGSDRDYTYDELLTRVFEIMREKNPDMVAGKKQKFVMRPPQVVRIGTKKSSFANFTEICKTLHRQPKHLLDFLLAELGTSGSVDGNSQLIIKGRFQQKQIENVLRRYIKEYVTCHTCRSPDTILQKDTRLFFLQCETCGSRCSVASIKSGFQVNICFLFFIVMLKINLLFF